MSRSMEMLDQHTAALGQIMHEAIVSDKDVMQHYVSSVDHLAKNHFSNDIKPQMADLLVRLLQLQKDRHGKMSLPVPAPPADADAPNSPVRERARNRLQRVGKLAIISARFASGGMAFAKQQLDASDAAEEREMAMVARASSRKARRSAASTSGRDVDSSGSAN